MPEYGARPLAHQPLRRRRAGRGWARKGRARRGGEDGAERKARGCIQCYHGTGSAAIGHGARRQPRARQTHGAARAWNSALRPSLFICGATGRRETAALAWRAREPGTASIQADAPNKLAQSSVSLYATIDDERTASVLGVRDPSEGPPLLIAAGGSNGNVSAHFTGP